MTTKTFNGSIKSISFKALPSEDTYGNLFRIWTTLEDGSVINMGNSKKEQFSIKEGKEYHNLQAGDVIFLKYEDTGKFKNSKAANLTLVTKASEVPVQAPKNNATATPTSNQGQPIDSQQNAIELPFKVYGEIKSIDGINAIVANEDGKDYKVILGKKDYGFLTVGMRITAKIDKDGNILSGFKSYPLKAPVQSMPDKISSVPDDSFSSKERQFKMSFGNMMNVAANTTLTDPTKIAFFAIELFQPAADLRVKLINQYKDSRSDNDVGAKLGDALKVAASVHKNSISEIIKFAEEYVIEHIKAEDQMKNILGGKVEESTDKNHKPTVSELKEMSIKERKIETMKQAKYAFEQNEQVTMQQTPPNIEPDFSEPPIDFDEQIPF
ncbi:hypothetical protein KLEP7_gp29 [Pseudaeromonas phage vB_PpeM_ KLEP7]|nr:hypothetical protein KLEP7_gp29 [Pseudaeromonas phage vB_PpeM_ KLEP7]